MAQLDFKRIPLRPPNPLVGWEKRAHLGCALLFVGNALYATLNACGAGPQGPGPHWVEGMLVLTSAISTLATLCTQVPAQNAIFSYILMTVLAGAVYGLNGSAGVPFGPIEYHRENAGNLVFNALPWPVPLLVSTLILNARRVAKLMLRRKRGTSHYGFWVMGASVLLFVAFQFGLDPYATHVQSYWRWKATKLGITWYTAPLTSFMGAAVFVLLLLLFLTPLLINKSPVRRPPTYQPLTIWICLSTIILVGTYRQGLTGAFWLTLAQVILVCALAMRASRRPRLKR